MSRKIGVRSMDKHPDFTAHLYASRRLHMHRGGWPARCRRHGHVHHRGDHAGSPLRLARDD
ncbi:MAG: hypothetical protein HXY41_02105 [Chloroflexi bacterium]|nr:hypothetical protein [Chloroflexota bacterium]